jgi:endonuclease/exonuclease/phosphatase family metal-dependent hydrolase
MRLLSYNIHKGVGGIDRRHDLERICRVIEAEQPDLICLQEVTCHAHRNGCEDQPSILTKYFNARGSCFQLNVNYETGGYGNLLLSRWPFQLQSHVCLRLSNRKPRGAQVVVVDTPEGPVHLTNWHLGLAERERHWQAEYLLQHTTFHTATHLPMLVVGDFNDWRNTLAAGPFARHRFQQVTSSSPQFRSFPAFLPTLAIDKAFLRGGVEVRDVRVVRSRLAFWASDHLPLVLDFHLRSA